MGISTTTKRILSNTKKQIKRSGWISWASVSIMVLAFLVLSIFTMVAYTSQLFLQSVENKPHIYVFFKVGTRETKILDLKKEWEKQQNIAFVDYTSEEQAKQEFSTHNELTGNSIIANEVKERNLPSSLAIRLKSIQDAKAVIDIVEQEKNTDSDVFDVRYSEVIINNIKDAVFWLRVAGAIVMVLLFIVIFSFTLLTVEFRTYSRAKEIEIMQLVGGSLWFIRMPFIIEGGFYGAIGALISDILLGLVGVFLWFSQATSSTKGFLVKLLGDLDWPQFTIPGAILLVLVTLLIGFIIGSLNSLIAIRRYIK